MLRDVKGRGSRVGNFGRALLLAGGPKNLEIMECACQESNRNPVLPDGTTGTILNKSLAK